MISFFKKGGRYFPNDFFLHEIFFKLTIFVFQIGIGPFFLAFFFSLMILLELALGLWIWGVHFKKGDGPKNYWKNPQSFVERKGGNNTFLSLFGFKFSSPFALYGMDPGLKKKKGVYKGDWGGTLLFDGGIKTHWNILLLFPPGIFFLLTGLLKEPGNFQQGFFPDHQQILPLPINPL